MSPDTQVVPGAQIDPKNSLALLAQFGAEYLVSLSDRPATRGCVEAQIRDCVQRLDAALNELAMLKASQHAGPVG
jgi:hypothetical protein